MTLTVLPSLFLSERSSSDRAAEDIRLTVGDMALSDRLLEYALPPRFKSDECRLKLILRQLTS